MCQGEDRRHRINCKNDVRGLEKDQANQQRGGEKLSLLHLKEMMTAKIWSNRDESLEHADQDVLFRVDGLFTYEENLDAGKDQERAKKDHDPVILHQSRS